MANFGSDLLVHKPMLQNTAMPNRPTHPLFIKTKTPVTLYHQQFRQHLGSYAVSVGNVGWYRTANGINRYPLHIFSDPRMLVLDFDGDPEYGSGLMSTQALEYGPFVHLFRFAYQQRRLSIVPIDMHVDEDMLNPDAITEICLTHDFFEQLTPEDQQRVNRWFPEAVEIPGVRPARPLTVAEVKALYGDLLDGEFRSYLFSSPHCIEHKSDWTPEVGQVFAEIKKANKRALDKGELAPTNWMLPVHKNGLHGNVPPDIRGLYGNLYDHILQVAQWGMPQGPAYDHLRWAVLAGMGFPYSAQLEALHAVDAAYQVLIMASAAFHFEPVGIPKLKVIESLRKSYPFAIRVCYSWPEELLGAPAPAGFNQLAERVRQQDLAALRQSGEKFSNDFIGFGTPMKVVEDL